MIALSVTFHACLLAATPIPFLQEAEVAALASEVSGETAKRTVEGFSRHHRMRGSLGFNAATEQIVTELKRYGLTNIEVLRFPADGKAFYGTQRSRPGWNAEHAELWEVRPDGERRVRLASWEAVPISLAQDSASADVTAELVDAGSGITETDYTGKNLAGKIVLASEQPGAVARLAVDRHGALGVLSYAQNQKTAWWGENEHLVRWGHVESFRTTPTFGFMISLGQARALQSRLRAGETIRLHAIVRAGQEPGAYEIATATIPGRDANIGSEEIVYSCHLDHPRPGANDNASGCATILEVARTLSKLIAEGRLAPPRRTIRFVWPAEIEGTLALLNGRPDLAARFKAAVHLDMVGGGPETKAIFHVTRGPASQPSFIYDLAQSIGSFVNEQSARHAKGGTASYPLVAPEGGKEALQAEMASLTIGSDHQVYSDSSFGIPAIYLNDWPDRYIHTNFDVPANVDPTKLKRAGFIAAASGYALANASASNAEAMWNVVQRAALRRVAEALEQRGGLAPAEGGNRGRFQLWHEERIVDSFRRFFDLPAAVAADAKRFQSQLSAILQPSPPAPPTGIRYRRSESPKGPMAAFGYDYFTDHYGEERAKEVRLPGFTGLRGSGGEYAYEALNLVDGRRTTSEIRDALSAIYGPVPLDVVEEYLRALESIGVVKER
ncbi:MAG TPA: M28 family peptidase [Thermoanaerobaculia bacterium]|nr:M28 family peptidase [Thermoanaerobaculia bacterium]